MHRFFLSYSHIDKDKYLDKFFDDLRKELHRKIGDKNQSPKDIAFKDDFNITTGTRWNDSLTNAIRTSQTMVCIYTRGYFKSEYCGKEFMAFRNRIAQYELIPNSQKNPPVIIPIIWENPQILLEYIPSSVRDIQYSEAEYGDKYNQKGLHILTKIGKFRDEYRYFLETITTKIITTTDKINLEEHPPVDMENVVSAFVSQGINKDRTDKSSNPTGPESAKFVFVAGNKAEISSIRKNTEYYGFSGGRDWLPYFPDNEKIGIIAQRIATNQNMHFENLEITNDFIDDLKKAEDNNSVVVIIVDPWSVDIDKYKKPMQDYDGCNVINSYIAIPWNERDEESVKLAEKINQNVDRIFCHCVVNRELELQTRSKSIAELEQIVSLGIQKAKTNIMKFSTNRRLIDKNYTGIPTLTGPGDENEIKT
jgi:FxsC-like protein